MGETNLTTPGGETLRDQLEALQQRAAKDALSGLMNRATMEQCIRDRMQTMTREETCALFIVDLDDFKQVNDTLGHQAGDQAIRKSGQILSSLFRASDIVGRLGGDEFAIFLCGQITEELVREKAAAICDKLHLALGDHKVVDLTASVGAYLASKGQAFEGLYQAADLALYKAKKAGKHRFCLKDRVGYQEEPLEAFRPVNTIPLSGLLENMDSGVALLEMGGAPRVIYVSPSFCRILGADPQTFPLPKPLAELIHPDDLVSLEETLREGLRREETVEHTHRVARGGRGQWAWWHIRATQVEYDAPDPVLLITTTDISQFKAVEEHQEEQIQRLQAAFDQTSKQLWEVSLPDKTFRAFTRDGKYRPLGKGRMSFPDGLIEGGWVHPNSVSRFRAFAQDLLDGHAQGYGNFAIRNRDTGYYSWASVSYRVIFDDVGRAARAVGVLEELPQSFAGQGSWTTAQRQMPEGLVADLSVRMRANLDLDTVEALWVEGTDLSGQVQKTRCSKILELEKQKIFCRGDQESFLECFQRERLLQSFREGRRWLSAEYRRVDGSGNIHWVRHILYLTEEPMSRQVYLFVYLIRIDPDHRLEERLQGEVRRDPVTRLYDREIIRRMGELLCSDRSGGNRAVAVFQINGLEKDGAQAGPPAEQIRYEIATALSLALGGSCILGQLSADQIEILFSAVTEKEDLRRRLEEAQDFLRRMLGGEAPYDGLRFLTGIDLRSAATAEHGTMLAQALRACAFWWNAAADTVAFTQEAEDRGWPQLQAREQDDQVAVHSSEMARPLSEREKDVALDCVSTMLTARTLDASITGVLQTIGVYYRADRVYTLSLVEDRRAVIMTYEWTSSSKRSIQQVVSGMRLERFPLLERCMSEGAPVFLTRQPPKEERGTEAESKWYFTALPLMQGQQVEGFLCIENAREHPADAALFSTLIPYMLLQRERFQEGTPVLGTAERLMGLPDLRAYMETIYSLSSQRFSSLGAVCLDIPGLATLNSSYGFEYGSRLLWYVARTLTELFGSSLLFRTWEAEFVIFFPNTTREVFLGRCGRLRSILQRRYPKQVRIGRVWAEGEFTGKRLVEEAKAAMRTEHVELDTELQGLVKKSGDSLELGNAVQQKRFTVYYQPQVDMRTGALAGAEALVRGIGEDGGIIPPARFIEFMEEAGIIRELDLFVLERALAQTDQWRGAGLGIVPVSVNLARSTVIHPTILASVLAIQSRYPEIPPAALELEITERGGDITTAELQRIVEEFRACGLHLSLDDFGSQYANLPLFTSVRFDTVKLDRSLISELVSNPVDRMLVRDIVRICHTYDMTCIAEGVENEEQIDALLEMGCIYAQGFYYDRPLPAETFEQKYLRSGAPGAGTGK